MLNRLISPTLIEEKIRIVNPGENRIPEYLEPYKMPENAKRILDAFEDDKPEDDRRIKRSLSLPYIQELQTRRQKADLKPYNGFKRYRVPIPEEITIARRLAKESHPLYEFIAKPKPLIPTPIIKYA